MASKLSQELVDMIVEHMHSASNAVRSRPPLRLTPYAVLSRTWQRAVESVLFREIGLSIEPDYAFPLAKEILSKHERFRYVRRLSIDFPFGEGSLENLEIQHPGPGTTQVFPDLMPCDHSNFGHRALFSQGLCWTLHGPHGRLTSEQWVLSYNPDEHFFLHATRLLDFVNSVWPDGTSASLDLEVQCYIEISGNPTCYSVCCSGSRLGETEMEPPPAAWRLPTTPAVRAVRIDTGNDPRPSSMWMAKLQSAMPSLQEIEWTFDDKDVADTDRPSPITESLAALNLDNLRVLHLVLPHITDFYRKYRDLRGVPFTLDPNLVLVNKAIRRVSTRLRLLKISGGLFMTPDMFWPRPETDSSDSEGQPCWPLLEKIKIDMDPVGDPFFSISQDFNGFYRTVSRAELDSEDEPAKMARQRHWAEFGELLVAVSRAMLRMPKLKLLAISPDECRHYPDFPGWEDDEPDPTIEGSASGKWAFCYNRDAATAYYPGERFYEEYAPLYEFMRKNFPGSGSDSGDDEDSRRWQVPQEALENWQTLCRRVTGSPGHWESGTG